MSKDKHHSKHSSDFTSIPIYISVKDLRSKFETIRLRVFQPVPIVTVPGCFCCSFQVIEPRSACVHGPDEHHRKLLSSKSVVFTDNQRSCVSDGGNATSSLEPPATKYKEKDIYMSVNNSNIGYPNQCYIYARYRFKQIHLKFLCTFADVGERPGWILPTANKILTNVTPTGDVDMWRGQVEGSEECGKFLSSAVELV
jgi:hypothetical protein